MQALKIIFVIVVVLLSAISWAYVLGKDAGMQIGEDRGRREQAELTPAACREMERIADSCIEHSHKAINALVACEVRSALLGTGRDSAGVVIDAGVP